MPNYKGKNGKGGSEPTNPCPDCIRPILDCPWLSCDKPVPGWVARPRRYRVGMNDRQEIIVDTWVILSCPLYIPAPERESDPAALTEAQSNFFLRRGKRK